MKQLDLAGPAGPVDAEWSCEPVDHSGAAAYVVLIRDYRDPERPPRKGVKDPERDVTPHRTIATVTADAWAARVMALLADGVARTFNRIAVELAGITADIAFGSLDRVGFYHWHGFDGPRHSNNPSNRRWPRTYHPRRQPRNP